jgi:S1-C subfamily serine protease
VASSLKIKPFSAVIVSGVLPGSPAELAGLQAGDLIDEVNRKRVQDVQSFKAALELSGADQDVLLRLQRGESSHYVAVKPQAPH